MDNFLPNDWDPDLSIWDSENSVCEKNQDPDWTYRAIAKRKTVKMIRKETKNVKTVTVTQGDDEEYDIEDVLKKLEVSEVPTENPDQGDQDQPTSDQPVEARFDEGQNVNVIEDPEQGQLFDEIDQNNSSINDKPTEVPSEPECTTCFEPRIRTFLLLPCGHATFCEKCAAYFCEIEDKNRRKCPTCRTMVTGKIRAFF